MKRQLTPEMRRVLRKAATEATQRYGIGGREKRERRPSDADILARAKEMRRAKPPLPWARIAAVTGQSVDWLRRRLDGEYTGQRNALIRERRRERVKTYGSDRCGRQTFAGQIKRIEERPLTAAEVRAARERIPKDTRDLTARIFGDPLPGRSALDKRLARHCGE